MATRLSAELFGPARADCIRPVAFTLRQQRTTVSAMKVLTYDSLARDFPKAWAAIETKGEEVVVTRRQRPVACIVPEPPRSTALVRTN